MRACFILGTRPEAIKVFTVVREFIRRGHQVTVFDTQQQKGAVSEFLTQFTEGAKYESFLSPLICRNLSDQLASQIREAETRLCKDKFDTCLVHGDTNSTFIGALAAFYAKTTIVHIEAGLRSGNIFSPFPEEINRQLVSRLATYHAAPTASCRDNLLAEGCSEQNIVVTGNTVIDAVALIKASVDNHSSRVISLLKSGINILVACHRRENREEALSVLCSDIRNFANSSAHFLVMLHPNPLVNYLYQDGLRDVNNVTFVEPLGYRDFVTLLDRVDGVITDSGGIQEEVTYLNKATLIFRSETERPEVLNASYVQLSANFPNNPIQQLLAIINSPSVRIQPYVNLFGDGLASTKIVDFIERKL